MTSLKDKYPHTVYIGMKIHQKISVNGRDVPINTGNPCGVMWCYSTKKAAKADGWVDSDLIKAKAY